MTFTYVFSYVRVRTLADTRTYNESRELTALQPHRYFGLMQRNDCSIPVLPFASVGVASFVSADSASTAANNVDANVLTDPHLDVNL